MSVRASLTTCLATSPMLVTQTRGLQSRHSKMLNLTEVSNQIASSMALLPSPLTTSQISTITYLPFILHDHPGNIVSYSLIPLGHSKQTLKLGVNKKYSKTFSIYYRSFTDEDDGDEAENCNFDEAVALFNERDYYRCHDYLEALWNKAQDPTRTLIHGILQCAVGFHHLFIQNHKGAMMELGEGLCKLRKMDFQKGPFQQFEEEISQVLDFIYKTQIELAACGDDLCITMDRSERSYQLLGGYAAGQRIYDLYSDADGIIYIGFSPQRSYNSGESPTVRVKLPTLNATTEHLIAFEHN